MGKAFIHRSAEDNTFFTHHSLTGQFLEAHFCSPHFGRPKVVLEPACGRSDITKVVNQILGSRVVQYDINHPVSLMRKDFYEERDQYSFIITNPPYGKEADKFVEKAKSVCTGQFAFLLRTNYLSGQTRYKAGIYDGLKYVYIFTRMPDLQATIRKDGKYPTAGIVYAWMVWEIGYNGPKIMKHIDNQKYVLKAGE